MTGLNLSRTLEVLERYFGIEQRDADSLIDEFETVDVASGDWLFRQSDPAESIFFLIRGRLQVWIKDADAETDDSYMVAEVTPGESVGEVGLLTGGVRSASIRAIRDSQLLRMGREDFERLAIDRPKLVMQVAGGIASRLVSRTDRGTHNSRAVSTIALLPREDWPWLQSFVAQLVIELKQHSSVQCLTSNNLGENGAPVDSIPDDAPIPDSLRNWLDLQEYKNELIVYVGDPGNSVWSRLCVRQSEVLYQIADSGSNHEPHAWEQKLLGIPGAAIAKRALILRHADGDAPIRSTMRWLANRQLDYHLHLRAGNPDDISRIARVITGNAIGLVLGAGAARGFAGIGAYRALAEAGVPVDWVGGSSIGGIIGAVIALDNGPDHVTETARNAFVKGKPFSDYTLPLISVIRGRRMEKLLKQHLEGAIEDLPLPFFCVSTLLDTGELKIHERDSVWRSLRATAAMPGLLPPSVFGERLAIDGAVLNSLPIDVMQHKPVGRIIAVSFASSGKIRAVDYAELPSPWSVLLRRIFPLGRRQRAPGLVSTILKSSAIGTAAQMRTLGKKADLLLQPAVSQFGLTDVTVFDSVIQAGYDDAQPRIAEWLDGGGAVSRHAGVSVRKRPERSPR